jgi:beta-N-acetylhexosaminidase
MLEAYQSGKISQDRMNEALQRILGLKAHMGLHKGVSVPDSTDAAPIQELAKQISKDSITLVKYKDEQILPLTPQKYRRVMIVPIKGAAGAMDLLIGMLSGEGQKKQSVAEQLRDRLIEKGFDAFVYVSPIDKMKQMAANGEKPTLNLYFAGKNAIEDFKKEQDLVISLFDVANGRPSFGMSKGGGEIPWYVFEIPVVGISVNAPTMLADVPQLRAYINAYDSKPDTLDALVDCLMLGPSAFQGQDPIDSFCGLWDTRI